MVSPWYERTMLKSEVCNQHMDSNPIIVVVRGIIRLTAQSRISVKLVGFEPKFLFGKWDSNPTKIVDDP